jgi:hypothetical protein
MTMTVADVDTLQTYIQGVMAKALHHGPGVHEIALAVIGAVVWKKDGDAPLKIHTYKNQPGNVLFVHIGGKRYAFSYNHDDRAIDIREDSVRGDTIKQFKNSDSAADVWDFFNDL